MIKPLITIILLLSIFHGRAQDDWERYVVTREKKPMVIMVNMRYDFGYARPNYRNLLIIGNHTTKCLKNGYPTDDGLNDLSVYSDTIANILNGLTKNRLVGVMTYKCSGFDIFYIKDTVGVRQKLVDKINKNFESGQKYLEIDPDRNWGFYHDSLYPKDLSYDFFVNNDLLTELVYEGDDLSQARKVSHWFYFKKSKKREKFIKKIGALEFKIDSLNFKGKEDYPYEVKVSRQDHVDPHSISKLTSSLSDLAELLLGKYDGWSTDLIINN
jgi:hypothetical protein